MILSLFDDLIYGAYAMVYNVIYNDPSRRHNIIDSWVYWDDVFTVEEIDTIVKDCTSKEVIPGKIFGSANDKNAVIDEQVRKSNIGWNCRTIENGWIFDRMNTVLQVMNERYYNLDLNGYDSFQYTEYDGNTSGHYDWHMDINLGYDSNITAGIRKLSMSILLNDDFEGGEFMINTGNQDEPLIIPTKSSRAIIFPSWIPHRVAPVTSGIRRSLVVWVVGPKFI
jgi:PKHD-type hydroxylase